MIKDNIHTYRNKISKYLLKVNHFYASIGKMNEPSN